MKVLMVLSNPLLVDPRVHNEAKALIGAGNEVTVVLWDRRREYGPESFIDGIRVVRIHNKGLIKILPNDIMRNPVWWRKAYKKGLELYRGGFSFDLVHCHDLDTLKAGVLLKKKLDCKLVYDAHEIFGYTIENDVSRFIVNYVFRMEKKLVKNVDHIITVNEPFKKYFKKITNTPVTVVMNCKDLIFDKYKPSKNKIFTVTFIGNLHRSRFFPQIIDTLGGMKNIRFVVAGKKENIRLYYDVENACAKYENVEFLGQIPFDRVIPHTCDSDVVLCILDPSKKISQIATANKQFEAMVCSRPIITTKGTYSGKMTEKLKCGLVVDYSKTGVRNAIIVLRENPKLCERLGENALKAAIEKYNWKAQKKKLIIIYENLTYGKK